MQTAKTMWKPWNLACTCGGKGSQNNEMTFFTHEIDKGVKKWEWPILAEVQGTWCSSIYLTGRIFNDMRKELGLVKWGKKI